MLAKWPKTPKRYLIPRYNWITHIFDVDGSGFIFFYFSWSSEARMCSGVGRLAEVVNSRPSSLSDTPRRESFKNGVNQSPTSSSQTFVPNDPACRAVFLIFFRFLVNLVCPDLQGFRWWAEAVDLLV